MLEQVTRIYDFNRVNGLLDKPYNDFLESSFQIEEALEGISSSGHGGGLPTLARILNENVSYITPIEPTHKSVSRGIIEAAFYKTASDLERLDKHIDSIVYNIGAIAKLGLTPSQLLQALSIVMDANEAKNGCPKDSFGKLMKPENFPNPEPRLEQLLAARD